MMILEFTPLEIRQLIIWARNTIEGGHFGDGNVVFPEEGITLHKLQRCKTGIFDASYRDLSIMKIWGENAIGQSLKGMTNEEISVVSKITEAIAELQKQEEEEEEAEEN